MEKFAATGRLAGTIAHEINNPMEAIKNAIYLLKGKLDEPSQPVYEVLRSETERVTRIVRQMLGLYRNTAQLGDFDLNSVLEDTLALFARPLSKAGVIVDKRFGDIPPDEGSVGSVSPVVLKSCSECPGQHAGRWKTNHSHQAFEGSRRRSRMGDHHDCGPG